MQFIIVAFGTSGDVNPNLGLALRLRQRGHEVVFAAAGYFEGQVSSLGFEFEPICSTETYLSISSRTFAAKRMDALHITFREVVIPHIRPVYRMIERRYVPGKTVVISQYLAFGARIANEKLGVPIVSVHMIPGEIRSSYLAAEGPGRAWRSRLPVGMRRAFLEAVDKWFLDPRIAPETNAFRAELGLLPVELLLDAWVYSPQLAIGMFPEWYSPRQPDWPPHFHLTGFPLYDGAGGGLPPDIENFLATGDAPVVVTAISAKQDAGEYFATAVAALVRTKRRGLLLSSFPEQLPRDLPPGIRASGYLPLSEVLPRSAALISQGGVGTTASALAAGVPHLIVPQPHNPFDQPFNGRRVTELGTGAMLRHKEYTAANIVRVLGELPRTEAAAERSRYYAAKLRDQDAIGETCQLFEDTFIVK